MEPGRTQSISTVDPHTLLRWDAGRVQRAQDELALEAPLEIRVRGRAACVTMRTPGHDDELAAGFLLSEGIITRAADIVGIDPCERGDGPGSVVNVVLEPTVVVDFDRLTRHVFASSSCGLCGKVALESVDQHFGPIDGADGITIPAPLLPLLPQRMRDAQAAFDRTGGLHAAAIFDAAGKLLVLREDVGRHNAVDKVLGFGLLQHVVFDRHVLLVSGRSSFEIVQKALAARVPVIAAVSAPSSLAVDFAAANGQTLVGFLRANRMNIYTHPRRIQLG